MPISWIEIGIRKRVPRNLIEESLLIAFNRYVKAIYPEDIFWDVPSNDRDGSAMLDVVYIDRGFLTGLNFTTYSEIALRDVRLCCSNLAMKLNETVVVANYGETYDDNPQVQWFHYSSDGVERGSYVTVETSEEFDVRVLEDLPLK